MNKVSLIMIFFIIFFISFNTTLSTSFNIKKTNRISDLYELTAEEHWNRTFGGEALDWGWSVQETTDGGFIIAGETVSFGSGGFDSWLIKTDSNGNETWNKTFGGVFKDGSRSVRQTNDGGYILGGYADSYGNPGHDAWFIKTDNDGNEEWDSIFGGFASDGTFSVLQTTDEGYIGVGYADSYGAGNHDLWLIRTDKYGNEEWNKTYGTAEWDLGYSVKECNDSGYIIIGTTESYGAGNQDAWLIKTDMNGTEEWNKTYGGKNNDWGSAVVIVDDGYLITGDTRSYGSGGYDIWLIKTDKYGNEQWKRVYGDSCSDDTGYSLIKTSDGGFAIIGTKTSFNTDLTDIFLVKTDNNGYIDWNITIDGGGDEWSYSVDETSDGGYIITGRTNSYGEGNYDLWLIKIKLVNNGNQPPTAPDISGPQLGDVGEEYEYFFVAEDFEGNSIFYYIDWDDGNIEDWFGPYPSGEIVGISHVWEEPGAYEIRAKSKDIYEAKSDWSDPYTIVIGNQPPNAPTISGLTNGKVGVKYGYTFNSTDLNNDSVMYYIDWGDNTTDWTEYGDSGIEIILKHVWDNKGIYTIKAKAKDSFGAESNWSEYTVTMPRSKVTISSFLLRFLERYPMLDKLLNILV